MNIRDYLELQPFGPILKLYACTFCGSPMSFPVDLEMNRDAIIKHMREHGIDTAEVANA